MVELEDKIKNLLESPEGINQVLKTAQALFGTGTADEKEELNNDTYQADSTQLVPVQNQSEEEDLLQSIDPKVITGAMQIMSEYKKSDDRRIQLLQALRSYFKDEDQIHITKAIRIVKLSKVAKQAFRRLGEDDSYV